MRSLRYGRVAVYLLTLLTLIVGVQAFAQDAEDNLLPVTEAYKLSADASTPGVVKLHWTIAQDYYLYRGRMAFKGDDGVTLGEAQLPNGEKHDDPYLGPVETYHHSVDATIPYTVAPGITTLALSVRYQGCHETDPKICYPPHTEHLNLALPTAAAPANKLAAAFGAPAQALTDNNAPLPAEQAFRFDAIAQDAQHLLLRWTIAKGYYLYRDQTKLAVKDAPKLSLSPSWPAGVPHQDAHFGNTTVYFNELTLPVSVDGDTQGMPSLAVVASFQGCQEGGLCYPLMTREAQIDLTGHGGTKVETAPNPAPEMPPSDTNTIASTVGVSLGYALLAALIGGLLLNLMPCVLPVLSLKVLGVLENSHEIRALRRHATFYTAGVLATFLTLGLLGHIFGKGLGAQLQYPTMVAVLACVMFAVGLWLSGVFHLSMPGANLGQSLTSRQGIVGDFFIGVLAVAVASPCVGPFMSVALIYAFAAPLAHCLAVFFALGLGLALPILAIAIVPALSRLLPRPGAWMETFKQFMAFPMYLSAVWLAWVVAKQRGADGIGLLLAAAVLLAMTLWWFTRSRERGVLSKMLVLVLILLTLVPLRQLAILPPPTDVHASSDAADGIVAYSPEKLAELRKAGTPVFVDMTADWCVTCKANEHAVLNGDDFKALLKRTGAIYMKGDWTNEDPAISAFLQKYHSPGVPLYVVFPKNGGAGQKLPTVLTFSLVEQALSKAAE
jgi:thiol:disulfide interchange protein DsbD